jgi:hypothetical protein
MGTYLMLLFVGGREACWKQEIRPHASRREACWKQENRPRASVYLITKLNYLINFIK